jgi:hypothetical protein
MTPQQKVKEIAQAVCEVMGVTPRELKSKKRQQHIVTARQLIHYFARIETPLSFYAIGVLTLRDHSTVIYSVRTIQGYLEIGDPIITNLITKIQNHVKNNETVKRLPIQAQIHRLSVGSLGSKGANGRHRPMFRPAQTYLPYHKQTRLAAG